MHNNKEVFYDIETQGKHYNRLGFFASMTLLLLCGLVMALPSLLFSSFSPKSLQTIEVTLLDYDRHVVPKEEGVSLEKTLVENSNASEALSFVAASKQTAGVQGVILSRSDEFFNDANTSSESLDFIQTKEILLAGLVYPSVAIKNGWSGTVKLSITLDEQGHLIASKIITPSGRKIFDDAVLYAVEKAKHTLFPKPEKIATLVFDIYFG